MTEEQNREKILERVRKLLALSTSSNEHEAALAAERAQAILAEYNLSMDEVVTQERTEDEVLIDVAAITRGIPWRHQIAQAVAKLYFCDYCYSTTHKNGNAHYIQKFIGAKHNIAIAKMMLNYLDLTIERLAANGAKTVPARERSPYRTSFRNMAAWRVSKRLYDRIEAAKKGEVKTEEGRNLPALINLYAKAEAAINDYKKKRMPGMRITKTRLANPHAKGYADGVEAGNSIGLDAQITKKAAHLIG